MHNRCAPGFTSTGRPRAVGTWPSSSPDTRNEINERLALPLKLGVIGSVLGVPEDDLPQFKTWGDLFLSTGPDRAADNERAVQEMGAYMGARFAASWPSRTRVPGTATC